MKRVNVYAAIREMREQIVKTMQERGITELDTYMSAEEWAKANGRSIEDVTEDDSEYEEYKWETAPYVVYFDKHDLGTEYRVEKVTLVKESLGDSEYTFKFDCVGSEDSEWFWEEDIYFDTRINVWDALEERLGIEDEPESVYLVKQESNVDGELHFNVMPCKDMETAKRVLAEEVKTLLAESPKYKDAKRWIDGDDTLNYDDCPYSWENDKEDAFYISCTCDDYHELITIEEKEIN